MKKFFSVIFKIILVLIIVALLLEALYLGLVTYDVAVDNTYTLSKGSYAVNPTWLADGIDTPIDTIYSGLSDDNKADIAFDIYYYICKKLMLTSAYGSRAKSVIKAWVGENYENASISADVTNNTSHQYKIAGTPTLNANQTIFHSYTNSVYLTETNMETLTKTLKSFIQFGNRYYYDGNKTYVQKGSIDGFVNGDEVFVWKEGYAEEKATASRTYQDSDIRDLDNFIITKNTILPQTCQIEREYSEEYGMYYYVVKFSLDCSAKGEGSATYYEVTAIKDLLGGFVKDIYYDQLDIELNLYSNGYLLTRSLVQNWTIKTSLGLDGHAKSDLKEVYNYKEDECAIVDFTK